MALKYAAGWHKIYGERGRDETLIALVGTAWSFAFALLAASCLNPPSLSHFATQGPLYVTGSQITQDDPVQSKRFIDAAREAEADEFGEGCGQGV